MIVLILAFCIDGWQICLIAINIVRELEIRADGGAAGAGGGDDSHRDDHGGFSVGLDGQEGRAAGGAVLSGF